MSLTYGFQTPRHLLEKLQRDATLLRESINSDRFFNFVITAYSLIDWVQAHRPPQASPAFEKEVASLRDQHWLKTCRDLANASKHFTLTRGQPIVETTTSHRGFGMGRYGAGAYGEGEERIRIALNDGTRFDCLNLVDGVVSIWEEFFCRHGL